MSDTSFISHRMFVAALEKQKDKKSKLRLSVSKTETPKGAPPGPRTVPSDGKEVIASVLAQHFAPRPAAPGI